MNSVLIIVCKHYRIYFSTYTFSLCKSSGGYNRSQEEGEREKRAKEGKRGGCMQSSGNQTILAVRTQSLFCCGHSEMDS